MEKPSVAPPSVAPALEYQSLAATVDRRSTSTFSFRSGGCNYSSHPRTPLVAPGKPQVLPLLMILSFFLIFSAQARAKELEESLRMSQWQTVAIDYELSAACPRLVSVATVHNAFQQVASKRGITLAKVNSYDFQGAVLKVSCLSTPAVEGIPQATFYLSVLYERPVTYKVGNKLFLARMAGDVYWRVVFTENFRYADLDLAEIFVNIADDFFDRYVSLSKKPWPEGVETPRGSPVEHGRGLESANPREIRVRINPACSFLPDITDIVREVGSSMGLSVQILRSTDSPTPPAPPLLLVWCDHASGINSKKFYSFSISATRTVVYPTGDGFFEGIGLTTPVVQVGFQGTSLFDMFFSDLEIKQGFRVAWTQFLSKYVGANQ